MATLIEQLIKKGVIDKKQASSLEYDIKVSGRKEEEIILEKAMAPEDVLFTLKSENFPDSCCTDTSIPSNSNP